MSNDITKGKRILREFKDEMLKKSLQCFAYY